MPQFGGTGGPAIYIQNTAPLNPAPGDFWFDTSGGTVLNFRTNFGSWLAVSIPTAALDTLSNSVSVLSQSVSVLSQSVSVISQSLSVLSNQVSVLSQQVSVVSQQVSVLSNAVSVLSQSVSVLSQSVSVLSNAVSVLSQQISVLSQQISVISNQVSVLSQGISVLSQQVSLISVKVDTHSNLISIGVGIAAGVGTLRVVGGVQGVSSTAAAGVNISGLSATVSAGGVFEIEGLIIYQMSVANALGISFNFPAMAATNAQIWALSANATGGRVDASFNEDASNSIVLSIAPGAATSTLGIGYHGVFVVSTGGTVQVQARVSAAGAPMNIQKGTYLRSRQIA